jgi:hypothetical protein
LRFSLNKFKKNSHFLLLASSRFIIKLQVEVENAVKL